jgi:SAM-dependent methyltransferase
VLPAPPARVLDVACGLGRHMAALEARGYECVGIELAEALADEARESGLDVRAIDMRAVDEIEGDFDGVICMWASFGWFDVEANARVLRDMAAKLRPGGVIALEIWNPPFFEAHQGDFEVRPGLVETKTVHDRQLLVEYDYGERFYWQLYEPDELAAIVPELTLAAVDRSDDRPGMRIALQASPASSGASAASPTTSDATVR